MCFTQPSTNSQGEQPTSAPDLDMPQREEEEQNARNDKLKQQAVKDKL